MATETVYGNTLVDSNLIGNITLRSRARMICSYTDTPNSVNASFDGTVLMATSSSLSNQYRVGVKRTTPGESSTTQFTISGDTIAVGTSTPTNDISYPHSIKYVTFSKSHTARTQTITFKAQTGYYVDTSTWSTASYTINIPAKTNYTVSYNGNASSGVSNVPSNQTKWYGESLTLSSTKPTRTGGYVFQGWATASGGNVAYSPGSSYTNNAAVTLYAKWQADSAPTITEVACDRCLSDGTLDDEGTYAKVTAKYTAITAGNSANKVVNAVITLGSVTSTVTLNAKTGTLSTVLGTFNVANTYTGTIVFTDSNNRSTTAGIKLPPAAFPIDVLFSDSNNAYSVGLLCPAASTGRVTIGGEVNINGEWIYLGNGTDAGLYTHTTGRNARVMLVRGYDANGASIELGAGGLTIVGGGEAAQGLYSEYVTSGSMVGGTEHLMLGADSTVYVFSNCGTIANRKEFRFTTAGSFIVPNGLYFGADDGDYHAHLTANGTYIYFTPDNTSTGTIVQTAINTNTGNILQRENDGSGYSSWVNVGGLPHSTFGTNAKITIGADAVIYVNGQNYRYVFTSAGNIRVDTSSDSGATWTSGGGGYAILSTTSRTANTVYAAPNGSAGAATFRKLVQDDLPTHNASNITPNASKTTYGGIATATSRYSSAAAGNWNYMEYSNGTVHAWGIFSWSGAIQTALGGQFYNSTTKYIQLPVAAKTIQTVTLGACLGGSAGFGAIAAPAGSTSDWSYTASTSNKYDIPFLVMSPVSRTSGTYYFPVDVWFMKA